MTTIKVKELTSCGIQFAEFNTGDKDVFIKTGNGNLFKTWKLPSSDYYIFAVENCITGETFKTHYIKDVKQFIKNGDVKPKMACYSVR